VLILKEVKVICFDTLLQVLILKGLAEERFRRGSSRDRSAGYWRYVAQRIGRVGCCENTQRVAGELEDQTGTLSATLG
jgi:hypothetical protein